MKLAVFLFYFVRVSTSCEKLFVERPQFFQNIVDPNCDGSQQTSTTEFNRVRCDLPEHTDFCSSEPTSQTNVCPSSHRRHRSIAENIEFTPLQIDNDVQPNVSSKNDRCELLVFN